MKAIGFGVDGGVCRPNQILSVGCAGADATGARAAFEAAIAAYGKALQNPEKLGKLQERCDARYNAACALALGGQHAQAKQLLQQLLAANLVTQADVAADKDLHGLHLEQIG